MNRFQEPKNGPRMKTLARAAGIAKALIVTCLLTMYSHSVQAEEVDYYQIGWWSIKYRTVDNLNWVPSSRDLPRSDRHCDGSDKIYENDQRWVLFIDNPRWNNWVQQSVRHRLMFSTTKLWTGVFSASDRNVLSLNVSIDFMNSVANAHLLTIMNSNKRSLAILDMKDSTAAIQAVVNCVRQHSAVPSPEAKNSPRSGANHIWNWVFCSTQSHIDQPSRCEGLPKRNPNSLSRTNFA